MKIALLYIIITLSLISCKSPTEVDANRNIKNKLEPVTVTDGLLIDKQKVYFGTINKYGEKSQLLTISNISDIPVRIDSINFKSQNPTFTIDNSIFPIVIKELGKDSSTLALEIKFHADNIGLFYDTLTINGYDSPWVELFGIVPSCNVNDVNFGKIPVNTSLEKAITIVNHGNEPLIIEGIEFHDELEAFEEMAKFPLIIQGGLHQSVTVRFNPKNQGIYKATCELIISGPGYKDNSAVLKGEAY